MTIMAIQFGQLLGGAVVTESVFGWPGLGRLILDAIGNRDYLVVQSTMLLFVTIFIALNVIADVVTLLDPASASGVALRSVPDAPQPPRTAANSALARPANTRVEALRQLVHDRAGLIGLVIVSLPIAAALFAPVLAPADPYEIGSGLPFAPPTGEHLMGTDDLGRDVYSRVLYGARVSLRVALFSVAAAAVIAVPLGLAAGYLAVRLTP